jgi:Ig-like domain from next to BRCA1 gene
MDTRRFSNGSVSICFYLITVVYVVLFLSACGSAIPPTPLPAPLSTPTLTLEQPTDTPTTIQPVLPTSTPTCTANLTFINDVTIPDGTQVSPGTILDKQWLVQNSGDCNWDAGYRLRLISGDALGAATEQALFPARAGTQAPLRILFTAPQEAGQYISEWQAFDPNGIAFGESFFIKFQVQP